MNAGKEVDQMESGGLKSHSAGSTEDQNEGSPEQPKSSLSRCAACYNHKAICMARRGNVGESSSSAEDSGPEVDSESEASSSCGKEALSEPAEKPSPGRGDAAGGESGGNDVDGQEEASESRDQDKSRKEVPFSLQTSLTPLPLLPRPHTVVSTLHLQVLFQTHDDNDALHIVKQHLSGREEEKTAGANGGGREGIDCPQPPQPFQWQRMQPTSRQHQLSYQPQRHQLHSSPHSAQGQIVRPPMHTLPVPQALLLARNAPLTHLLPATPPPPCWCCYSTHCPHTYHTH